jgi:hypothetical protein
MRLQQTCVVLPLFFFFREKGEDDDHASRATRIIDCEQVVLAGVQKSADFPRCRQQDRQITYPHCLTC